MANTLGVQYQYSYPTRPQTTKEQGGGLQSIQEYQGVPYTIDRMRDMVYKSLTSEQSGQFRQLTESIVSGVRSKDYLSEIAAVYYYALVNMRYLKDPVHVERLSDARVVNSPQPWDRMNGRRARNEDCDSYAINISSLCNSMGASTDFVTVSTRPDMVQHHVFTAAKHNNARLVLDPIAGPDVSDMLRAVTKFVVYPVEPVRFPGRPGWGVAGPSLEGYGFQTLNQYLNPRGRAIHAF